METTETFRQIPQLDGSPPPALFKNVGWDPKSYLRRTRELCLPGGMSGPFSALSKQIPPAPRPVLETPLCFGSSSTPSDEGISERCKVQSPRPRPSHMDLMQFFGSWLLRRMRFLLPPFEQGELATFQFGWMLLEFIWKIFFKKIALPFLPVSFSVT